MLTGCGRAWPAVLDASTSMKPCSMCRHACKLSSWADLILLIEGHPDGQLERVLMGLYVVPGIHKHGAHAEPQAAGVHEGVLFQHLDLHPTAARNQLTCSSQPGRRRVSHHICPCMDLSPRVETCTCRRIHQDSPSGLNIPSADPGSALHGSKAYHISARGGLLQGDRGDHAHPWDDPDQHVPESRQQLQGQVPFGVHSWRCQH